MIVLGSLATATDFTAETGPPLIIGAAIGGFVLGGRPRLAASAPAALAALLTFCIYGAPALAYGDPTFTGYLRLDDTASWLALADQVFRFGTDVPALAPSSYEATIDFYIGSHYPLGGLVPLAASGWILTADLAWLWQPYLSVLAALLAAALWALGERVFLDARWRVAASVAAASPALLLGYTMWGGFKEIAAACLLATLAALLVHLVREPPEPRALVAPVVVTGAILNVLSVGGIVWVAPLLATALILLARRYSPPRVAGAAGIFAIGVAVLSLVTIANAGFLSAPAASTITETSRLANLIEPLDPLQVAGIWPAGDFRRAPEHVAATHVLVVVALALALIGLATAWRRPNLAPLLYAGGLACACVLVVALGSAWVDAKAYAITAPGVLFAAAAGAAWARSVAPLAGALATATLVVGVGWSAAATFQGTTVAPHARLAELEQIGDAFAGEGPALMTEFEPYGVRYFLRKLDPEGVSELRRRQIPLRSGRIARQGEKVDLDQVQLRALLVYRTLVLRRSPFASRPPASYRRRWVGRFYEVWQRRSGTASPDIIAHSPLGTRSVRDGPLVCDRGLISDLRLAPDVGVVASRPLPAPVTLALGHTERPASWSADANDDRRVYMDESGTATANTIFPEGGRYRIWLGGSVQGKLEVLVDGIRVGQVRHELTHGEEYVDLGEVDIPAGKRAITLRYGGPDIHPGSAAESYGAGPLVMQRIPAVPRLDVASRTGVDRLCGREYDWLEVVAR